MIVISSDGLLCSSFATFIIKMPFLKDPSWTKHNASMSDLSWEVICAIPLGKNLLGIPLLKRTVSPSGKCVLVRMFGP